MQRVVSIAISVAAVVLSAGSASADGPPGPQGDSVASIAKLPDWGGIWEVTRGGRRGAPSAPPSLTAPYAAKLAEYQDAQRRGEIQDTPAANCVPPGMPNIMTQPYPIEILVLARQGHDR